MQTPSYREDACRYGGASRRRVEMLVSLPLQAIVNREDAGEEDASIEAAAAEGAAAAPDAQDRPSSWGKKKAAPPPPPQRRTLLFGLMEVTVIVVGNVIFIDVVV